MNAIIIKVKEVFEKLSPEPPPREVFIDYRRLLQQRKEKVERIAKIAADDGNIYAAIRSKQILRKIESFDYLIISQ